MKLFLPAFLIMLCLTLMFAPTASAQKSMISGRNSGGKDAVKSNDSRDDISKDDVKSWSSGSNDNDNDEAESSGGGFSIWGNSSDDDEEDDDDEEEEEAEESSGGSFSIWGNNDDDEEETEVANETLDIKAEPVREVDTTDDLQAVNRKSDALQAQEEMEVYLERYRGNREGKQAIKDAQGPAPKDIIKDRPVGGNSGVFIDNVQVANPRPGFVQPITGMAPSATPRPVTSTSTDGSVGYSSGEYGLNSGAFCIVPPVNPICLQYDEDTEVNDALACVEDNRLQLEVLYAGAYWCDPGFLDCYYQYLMAYRHCYSCLPVAYQSDAMINDYSRLSDEYEYWVADCAAEEYAGLPEVRRYLRIKSSMLPSLLVDVDEKLEADFLYIDTAFGLPYGGANFYAYVMDFNPAEVQDTLPLLAEIAPEISGTLVFQDLEGMPQAFMGSDFRKLLLRKIGEDYRAARRLKKEDRLGAYALGENTYRLAQALEALVPDDTQAQIWRSLCANFIHGFGKMR